MKRLLADIEAGKIDVVVVYKVDRLTRSLTDFAKIVEIFDAAGVSFVSVTQAFNTTTSMGRLTLNVLLSFAQFEREVTGERIRDKIAASKKKGMWMGGPVPIGYDVPTDALTRALVVNETEAETCGKSFVGTLNSLRCGCCETGLRRGYPLEVSHHQGGEQQGCRPIDRGQLFHLLKNRTYLGEIPHRDTSYPGAHQAIVDRELFDAVQQMLATQTRRHESARSGHPR